MEPLREGVIPLFDFENREKYIYFNSCKIQTFPAITKLLINYSKALAFYYNCGCGHRYSGGHSPVWKLASCL